MSHATSLSVPHSSELATASLYEDTHPDMMNHMEAGGGEEQKLQAPLLSADSSIPLWKTVSASMLSPAELTKMKMMSVLSGSLLAFFSQLVLSKVLWTDNVLQREVSAVVVFSLSWSFWTCLIVFLGMRLFIQSIKQRYPLDEDLIFQMEAHNVAGALSAVALAWIVNDVFHVHTNFLNSPRRQWIVVAGVFSTYCMFITWVLLSTRETGSGSRPRRLRGNTHESHPLESHPLEQTSMLRTYQLIAALTGLLMGSCSQFLLATFFWSEEIQGPALSNRVLSSLIWGVCTVITAVLGCRALQYMVDEEENLTMQEHNIDDPSGLRRKLTYLRLESYHCCSTLVGVAFAWIFMDIFLDVSGKIVPSLVMLFVSMVGYKLILLFFPEKAILETHAQEQEIVEL